MYLYKHNKANLDIKTYPLCTSMFVVIALMTDVQLQNMAAKASENESQLLRYCTLLVIS